MAIADALERLAMIAGEGPRQTSYDSLRLQRQKQRQSFIDELRAQQALNMQFNATIPHQNYQDQDQYGNVSGFRNAPGGGYLSMYPLKGKLRVTSGYGEHRKGHKSAHTGIDWGAALGTTIYAPTGGRVRSTRFDKIYGNQTIIDIGNGRSLMFGHQSGFTVKPGQMIYRGMPIGYVGSTGWSTGPHLHFETWQNNRPVNPLSWFV